MSVSSSNRVRTVSPRPLELDRGLELEELYGTVTGDVSGGTATITFQFNPDTVTKAIYVAIMQLTAWDDAGGGSSVVALQTPAAEFARLNQSTANYLDEQATVSGAVNLIHLVHGDDPVYVGRVSPGATGDVNVVFDNSNTTVFQASGWAITGDRPFLINNGLSR